jgi:hypothetical protein
VPRDLKKFDDKTENHWDEIAEHNQGESLELDKPD